MVLVRDWFEKFFVYKNQDEPTFYAGELIIGLLVILFLVEIKKINLKYIHNLKDETRREK